MTEPERMEILQRMNKFLKIDKASEAAKWPEHTEEAKRMSMETDSVKVCCRKDGMIDN